MGLVLGLSLMIAVGACAFAIALMQAARNFRNHPPMRPRDPRLKKIVEVLLWLACGASVLLVVGCMYFAAAVFDAMMSIF